MRVLSPDGATPIFSYNLMSWPVFQTVIRVAPTRNFLKDALPTEQRSRWKITQSSKLWPFKWQLFCFIAGDLVSASDEFDAAKAMRTKLEHLSKEEMVNWRGLSLLSWYTQFIATLSGLSYYCSISVDKCSKKASVVISSKSCRN